MKGNRGYEDYGGATGWTGQPCIHTRVRLRDEVLTVQDRHLKEVVGNGEMEHQAAMRDMKVWWKDPIKSASRYRQATCDGCRPSRRSSRP